MVVELAPGSNSASILYGERIGVVFSSTGSYTMLAFTVSVFVMLPPLSSVVIA